MRAELQCAIEEQADSLRESLARFIHVCKMCRIQKTPIRLQVKLDVLCVLCQHDYRFVHCVRYPELMVDIGIGKVSDN